MRDTRKLSRLLVFLCGFLGCTGKDPLQQELILLRESTILAPTNIIEKSELVSNRISATATWVFETELDWESYTKSVKNNLLSYIASVNGPKQLRLRREVPGDVFVVDIDGSTQQIRITFHAFPK